MLLAFDLYGTLLSTTSISKALAEEFGEAKAESLALLWRRYQIEYTFRLNSMKQYEDFEQVTRKALVHTLLENGIDAKDDILQKMMVAYGHLTAFDDVIPNMQKLGDIANVKCVIFSNGNREMIKTSVSGSELSTIDQLFEQSISVDHLRSFKPAPEVYRYLANCTNMSGKESKIWLISSNPFDIVGARNVGMNAVWVDRKQSGWQDRLGSEPTKIINTLSELVDLVQSMQHP